METAEAIQVEFTPIGDKGYGISPQYDYGQVDGVAAYAQENFVILDLPFANLAGVGSWDKFKFVGTFTLLQMPSNKSAMLLAKVEKGSFSGSVQMSVPQFKTFTPGDDIFVRVTEILESGRKKVEFSREPFSPLTDEN